MPSMDMRNPSANTPVTSTFKVCFPGASEFGGMLFDQALRCSQFARAQTLILAQFDHWFQPKLGLTSCASDMNVAARLLAREEVEPQARGTQDSRAHEIEPSLSRVIDPRVNHVGGIEIRSSARSPSRTVRP